MRKPLLLKFIVAVIAATAVLWPANTLLYLWNERADLNGKTIEGTIGAGWFAVSVAEPLLFSLMMGAVAFGLWRGSNRARWAGLAGGLLYIGENTLRHWLHPWQPWMSWLDLAAFASVMVCLFFLMPDNYFK
ncbi:Uncharacterised protein [Kingella potus]|uniref:Uncharacterized protein n=2 Tax=Kingella potus TaxID=265175 RepID=A0A377QZV8_9NEIS|nr:hypothetical protein [Kingella potus]STR00783.1 Uncharacterised protein [Kingella potus]